MTKKNIPLKPHILKSKMGLFAVDDAWLLVYIDPYNNRQAQESFDRTDESIIDLLYTIKENCLGHCNSKHNDYNIEIKRVKVKK